MLPILFHIGNFPVHTYGVLIAAGFLTAVQVAKKLAPSQGIDPDKLIDMAFWCLLYGMIGARLLFVITRFEYFRENPLQTLFVWEGGLVFYGGPIAALFYIIYFCKKNKYSVWKVIDICAISLPLAHAIGRLGCLSAGCCHGRETHQNWGIKLYSELVEPSLRGVYIHPTQAYEAVALGVLTFYLYRRMSRKKFDGELAFIYVISYSVIRSVVEIFRGDSIRGFVIDGVLSTSQFISILTALTAVMFMVYRKKSLKIEARK